MRECNDRRHDLLCICMVGVAASGITKGEKSMKRHEDVFTKSIDMINCAFINQDPGYINKVAISIIKQWSQSALTVPFAVDIIKGMSGVSIYLYVRIQ